jgi:phosphoglycerol transferase MdoB-like AlkP superfamily enzyme
MVMPKAAGYFNNLALADSELGALRRDMEKSGQWDKTWVILSADHSWRISKIYDGVRDYRVPFLVKPPQASQSLTYSNPINTVLTHDLILAILRNQVTNQPSTAAWLDLHATTDLPVIQPDAPFE